ncbi:hypothetical protein VOLCADRAFT_105653 [Volvox carteri f. nagariensis]|uniref:Pherophorin domain-containing protein n=1 Tax=Volvox carteri f. nagariensis TaxID=3068 RepID=D8U248_VOLCA|nr:uncharacterized protein VOLCADRAFT_105653 [Volvox carteri f. nagariensis]EFJ46300.1 hypothetical protein VOLCADRAFT_105653 [Volvox carteri f. nagariensis]|eukprot:XP_002952747.1 hypothetical protein VOLCADRAFT_105653 [Volvox carteri f. nagariensis]
MSRLLLPAHETGPGAVLMLALVAGMAVFVRASYLTGTMFPYENCVQNTKYSRFSASFSSYSVDTIRNTSTFCIRLHVGPTCVSGPYRCCNPTAYINKIKLSPSLGCRGSVGSVNVLTPSGKNYSVSSIYFERHMGQDVMKVTPLMQWLKSPDAIRDVRVCFNLKRPCWNLNMFSYNTRKIEYSLYDKKVDDYECCPVGVIGLPQPPSPPPRPSRPFGPGPSSAAEPTAP